MIQKVKLNKSLSPSKEKKILIFVSKQFKSMSKLLNTSFIMETQTVERFKSFISKKFIPQLRNCPSIGEILFLQVEGNPHGEEAETFALQFCTSEDEKLQAEEQKQLETCLQMSQDFFGQQVLIFSTQMNIVFKDNA